MKVKSIACLVSLILVPTVAASQAEMHPMLKNCYNTFGPDGGQRRSCQNPNLPDVGKTPQTEWHSKRGCNANIDAHLQQCLNQANAWIDRQNRSQQ